jgi:hypothetical protein
MFGLKKRKYPEAKLPSYRVETISQVFMYYVLYGVVFGTALVVSFAGWLIESGMLWLIPSLTGILILFFCRTHNRKASTMVKQVHEATDYRSFSRLMDNLEGVRQATGISKEMMDAAVLVGNQREIFEEAKPLIRNAFSDMGFDEHQSALMAISFVNCNGDTGKFLALINQSQYDILSSPVK